MNTFELYKYWKRCYKGISDYHTFDLFTRHYCNDVKFKARINRAIASSRLEPLANRLFINQANFN